MAIAIEQTYDDTPVQRPGDFYRSKQGTPYVSDPTGRLVKPKRKSDPPRIAKLAYGRPSGFGKQIEDQYNLTKWTERSVALGFGVDPTLIEEARKLTDRDRDTPEWRHDADGVVVEAKRLAKTGLAADRGTHTHALAEDDDEGRDIIARLAAGEELGLDEAVQRALVGAWQEMLEIEGLEILATEFAVVNDHYRQAGTGDRIARLTKPMRFSLISGEIVELPAGTVVVLDIKTGKRRLDNKGVVMYWQGYAVQIVVYASGLPYDTATDERGEWPFEIDQHWALIAHLDVLGALDGNPTCTLVLVDIEAGRAAAELCLAAKAWEARTDVFSISQLEVVGEETASLAGDAEVPGEVAAGPMAAPGTTERDDGSMHGARVASEEGLVTGTFGSAAAGATSPSPAAAMGTSSRTFDGPDPERIALVDTRAQLATTVDEGADLSGAAFGAGWEVLQRHYSDLDAAAKSWLSGLMAEATKRGLTFHARHQRSLRVFELYRALIFLCETGGDQDVILRALLAIELGDVALFPSIHPGHAVGSLDATAAGRFAELVVRYNANELASTFDDDGVLRLVA